MNSGFAKKNKNPIFIRDARHVLPWRRTVSNVRRGIFPEIVVSMETVTQADYSIQEKHNRIDRIMTFKKL